MSHSTGDVESLGRLRRPGDVHRGTGSSGGLAGGFVKIHHVAVNPGERFAQTGCLFNLGDAFVNDMPQVSQIASHAFDFTETDYYAATMGLDLKKQFLAAERLIDPALLAAVKRQTNEWEAEYAALDRERGARA